MKLWRKETISVEHVRTLHEKFGLDYISATLLTRRNIYEKDSLKYYLESELSYLHNPFLFEDMEQAVERVLIAKEEGEKVRILGDRDVDGITSTAILSEALTSFGLDVSWRLPEGDEPYGLTRAQVEEAHSDDVTLIITVDCGISNVDEVEYASSLGIDVIVTDHHIAGDYIPDAVAVIDPKIEECEYPFRHLAGCGVAVKFVWAVAFGISDFFQQEVILLHSFPGNSESGKETVIIEAVKLRNLTEMDRMVEEVVPGVLSIHQSRIVEFLNCALPILVLDVDTEMNLLNRAFSKKVDIHLGELRNLFGETIPQVKQHSLFSLKQMSKSIRYSRHASELDVLISLFSHHAVQSIPYLKEKYSSLFDLVALGTIADLMPMDDENRIMVKQGLKELSGTGRPGLIVLLNQQNLLGKQLATTDIGWKVTPVINASGRMGKPSIALKLLLCSTQDEAAEYAQQLFALNRERQKSGEDSWNILLPKAKKSCEEHEKKFLVVEDRKVNRGLTGIMASRLMKQFSVPAMVIAHIDETRVTGSIRSPGEFDVREFLASFDDLFIDYGGHRCAGGFSMVKENLGVLNERLRTAINSFADIVESEEEVSIDVELPPQYLTPDIIRLVELLEPYGEGNPPIHFFISKAVIDDVKVLQNNRSDGENHVKMTISYGTYKWPALMWNGASFVADSFKVGDEIDMVFRMGRNYFRNQESLQLTVVDVRPYRTPLSRIMRVENES